MTSPRAAYYFTWINPFEGYYRWITDGGRRQGRAGTLEAAADAALNRPAPPPNVKPEHAETNRLTRKP